MTGDNGHHVTGGPGIWTPNLLLGRLDGDDSLARQLVTMFLAEYPALLGGLRTQIAAGDAEGVRRAAHALKGCVANFVEGGPCESAFEIETVGTSGCLAGAPAMLLRLEAEIETMASLMREFESRTPCES